MASPSNKASESSSSNAAKKKGLPLIMNSESSSSTAAENKEGLQEEAECMSKAQRHWALLREHVRTGDTSKAPWAATLRKVRAEVKRIRDERSRHSETWQSINYSSVDNATWRKEVRDFSEARRARTKNRMFFLVMAVGLLAGLLTVFLLKASDAIHDWKTQLFMGAWQESGLKSWLLLLGTNVILLICSISIILFWKPFAAGSGIPEVKAYLNGIMLPHAWDAHVFVAKVISTMCACATGLPVGPEGPLIYLGGNMGHFMTSQHVLKKIDVRWTPERQRTAITLGVTAGVSAAFGAPIGALLFTVEEISSIFTTDLLWTGFICSLGSFSVTIIVPYLLFNRNKEFVSNGLFSVGHIEQWQLSEIPSFVVLGVFMGALGALFNTMNVKVVNNFLRRKYIRKNRRRQVMEIIIVAIVLSTAWFFLPAMVTCLDRSRFRDDELRRSANGLWCNNPENEYNPLSTLMFASLDESVKYLFLPTNTADAAEFPVQWLALYSLLFFIACCYMAGGAVATGIFIPMIVIGAGLGRSYGTLLQYIFPRSNFDVAAFAVVGAAGFISGVTRIAVSMAVIMLEISDKGSVLLPIMIVTGVAKFVGDQPCFRSPPLYDMILEMRHAPFLEPEPTLAFEQLRCYDVMQRPVKRFAATVRVSEICDTLNNCAHNGFPVVDSLEENRLLGIISRAHLEIILSEIDFFLENPRDFELSGGSANEAVAQMSSHYRATHKNLRDRAHDYFETELGDKLDEELDLHRWMNAAPVTIQQKVPMQRAFYMFKAFGLRQLPVVNTENKLVGILTRHDLHHLQHHPGDYRQIQDNRLQHREYDWLQARRLVRSGSSRNFEPPTPSAMTAGAAPQLRRDISLNMPFSPLNTDHESLAAPFIPPPPRCSSTYFAS